jgi:hypothetical protein
MKLTLKISLHMKFFRISALLLLPLFILTITSSAQPSKSLPQLGKNPVKEVIAAMTPEEKWVLLSVWA